MHIDRESVIESLYYPLRIRLSILLGRFMRRTDFRFSREYRHGETLYHRVVYTVICTLVSNNVADGGDGKEWQ